jgi:hypothetical protein
VLLSVNGINSISGRQMNMNMEKRGMKQTEKTEVLGEIHVNVDSEVQIFSYCLELFGT